jgi:hypothetical protein
MPATKPYSKKARNADEKSIRAITTASPHSFARVEKVLGGRQFHVNFFDGEQLHTEILASPRGVLNRGRMSITTGTFVLLEGADIIKAAKKRGQDVKLEIYGVLDKPTADRLYSSGHIHSSIYKASEDALDDLFVSAEEETAVELDIDAI